MFARRLRCIHCQTTGPLAAIASCPNCAVPGHEHALNETLVVEYDLDAIGQTLDRDQLASRRRGLWRHAELLPVERPDDGVDIGAGDTPLVRLPRRLSGPAGRWWAKTEGANPTGSFKDRPVTVSLARAREDGADELAVFTSGNVGSALSAACAAAGLPCHVFLLGSAGGAADRAPVNPEKLAQIAWYGAEVLTAQAPLDVLFALSTQLEHHLGWAFLHRYQAFQADGDKTTAFEICAQLDWQPPAVVVVPVGTGTNLFGMYEGFRQYHELGFIDRVPRMVAVQPEGAASLHVALEQRLDVVPTLDVTSDNAAPPITHRVAGQHALLAVRASGGTAVAVSDDELNLARADLAARAGIYCETASAAALAGLRTALRTRAVAPDEDVVLVLTSSGLKDPGRRPGTAAAPTLVRADWDGFEQDYVRRRLDGAGNEQGVPR